MNQFNNFTRFLSLRDHIVGIDQKVPVLDSSLHPYINFDNAESTPALRQAMGSVGLCCTNPLRDSSCESSVIAWVDEQTEHPELQDPELARV